MSCGIKNVLRTYLHTTTTYFIILGWLRFNPHSKRYFVVLCPPPQFTLSITYMFMLDVKLKGHVRWKLGLAVSWVVLFLQTAPAMWMWTQMPSDWQSIKFSKHDAYCRNCFGISVMQQRTTWPETSLHLIPLSSSMIDFVNFVKHNFSHNSLSRRQLQKYSCPVTFFHVFLSTWHFETGLSS